jgi:pimeloyl-ACP methyl ester carboxylesterase
VEKVGGSALTRIFGQRIHWTETGNGPVLILLHGLGSESSEWGRVSGTLAKKRRVVTPDQIGFGQSDKPFVRYRIGTLVSFLEGLYRELKIDRASLIGHGVSGTVAAAFALAHPELVERLVLIAAGFLYAGQDPSLLNPATRDEARRLVALTRHEKDGVIADEVFAESMRSGLANQALIESIARGEDLLDGKLGGVRHPTLLVWGREDRLTPIAVAERAHAEIVGSQVVVLDKCGHAPHQEQPEQLAAVLDKFLSGGAVHQKMRRRRDEENVWF